MMCKMNVPCGHINCDVIMVNPPGQKKFCCRVCGNAQYRIDHPFMKRSDRPKKAVPFLEAWDKWSAHSKLYQSALCSYPINNN